MRNNFYIILIFCTLAHSLTEQEVMVKALKNNPDIQISIIKSQIDSLSVEREKTRRLPSLTINVSGKYVPIDTSTLSGTNNLSITAEPNISFSQSLFYGMNLNAAVDLSASRPLKKGVPNGSKRYSINVTQPLLKDAWENASLDYALKIEALNHKEFTLNQKKDILAAFSNIRTLFWSWYEKNALVRIAENEMKLDSQQLDKERKRFSIGDASEVDTLNAAIELLRAWQNLLLSHTNHTLAAQDLADALLLNKDSLIPTMDTTIIINDLPDAELFLTLAQEYDPQLHIFELLRQKYELQTANSRNQLLPQLDVNASYTYEQNGRTLFSPSTFSSRNAVVSLILRYPLFEKKSSLDLMQSTLNQRQNTVATDKYKRTLKKKIEELLFNWQQEKRNVEIMKTTKTVALRNLIASQKGYEAGSVDQLAFIKAVNDYVSISTSYLQAQIGMKKLEILFDEITGNVINRFRIELQ